ncbi:MAG: HEAT repeat domain-containing protein [Elusimicrobia bacterium]|nr:HEAT repeat domain-containing protein [Elusimicrobiota bacterium]
MNGRAWSLALLSAALLLSKAPCRAAPALKGVDLYRSQQLALERVDKELSGKIQAYMRLRGDSRKSLQRSAQKLHSDIEAAVGKMGRFAFVRMDYAEFATSASHDAYITFDLVDEADAAKRMPFRPRPKGSIPDPDGLIAAWTGYSELGYSLIAQGLLGSSPPRCPGYYCLWGPATPELAALERQMADGVERAKPQLLDLLEYDKDPQKRANALYVLSFLKDGPTVSGLMTQAITDPDFEVRGAALSVLSDIARYHKGLFIEINRVLPMLDFPTVSDRSQALALLVAVADNPIYRVYLESRAPRYLLPLLKQRHPNTHDLSYTLLSMLSQQRFDRRDYASWERWVASQDGH